MKRKKTKVQEDVVQANRPKAMSGMDSNSSQNTEESLGEQHNDNDQRDKKRGRGSTKFRVATPGQKPQELLHNEHGQPVGKASKKYSSFLGCLTKEFVSYTLKGWNYLDGEVKDRMWECLQSKYDVQVYERKPIFQHVGKLWRDRKSKLRRCIRDVDEGKTKSRDFTRLKPDFMGKTLWNDFVTETLSPMFRAKTEKYRRMRAKQNHNHTTGRRGYARLEHKMKKKQKPGDPPITRVQVWVQGHMNKDGQPSNQAVADTMNEILQCPPESQTTTTIDDDAISLVFGKEARGRVRGMGFGVTPSKMGAQIRNNVVINQLQDEVRSLNEKFDELRSMMLAQASGQQLRQQQNASGGGIVGGTGNGVDGGGVKDATPQSNRRIRANMKCKLLHPSSGAVVAEGRIASTDPKAKVHHIEVGEYFWKVWVDKVLAEDVALIRPNDEMTHLEHARGSTIAWLSKFITIDD